MQASFHQVGDLAQELDDADLEIEEREASDHCWYEAAASAREALAEEARADAGESKFAVADSLRISWLVAQRSDTTLYEKKAYRLATDGLLEKCVIAKDRPVAWVPVVPQGNATTHLSWGDGCGCKTISEFLVRTEVRRRR